MDRLTLKSQNGEGYVLPVQYMDAAQDFCTGPAVERLACFENFYTELAARQQEMADSLEKLRSEGKKNSVKFKETLGQKMIESNILAMLKIYGIG